MSTTSFTWKRKATLNAVSNSAKVFAGQMEANDEGKSSAELGEELVLLPLRRIRGKGQKESDAGHALAPALEDKYTKATRLRQEGCFLAENDRLWEAVRKWNEAIQLTPTDEKLHEMKAQALMELQEVLLAVQEAEQAVKLKPTWWIAHQTLGRAQLGIGEVALAIKSFSQACHLNPAENELWEDDMKWALSLREKALVMGVDNVSKTANVSNSIVELDDHLGGSTAISESSDSVQNEDAKKLSKNSWIRMREC